MNNPTAEIDNLIRRIDDELLILQDAPRLKKYKFYNFGVALKHLIESCQKHGLDTNPYYGHKIQEYIAVYRDLFGGANLKNNVVSDLQPNGVIIVSSSLPPKVSKVCELLAGCKVDYSVFVSEKCPEPNIILSKYNVDKYSDETEYYKACAGAYCHLTEVCWNVGRRFNMGANGHGTLINFEQYIADLKAKRAMKDTPPFETFVPNMELFASLFVPERKGWWNNLIIDITGALKSGKGGLTVVAMAKVLYDSGKLHPVTKPKNFAAWLKIFCQAWSLDKIPTSKAGNNGVKKEITRIHRLFYYLDGAIPK